MFKAMKIKDAEKEWENGVIYWSKRNNWGCFNVHVLIVFCIFL